MNHHYGVLRVIRILPRSRATAGGAQMQDPSAGGWLPTEGLVHVLKRREITIGRALSNDVVLLDLTVSREHARLSLDQAGWHILNLTEQNVVRVNGHPVPYGYSLSVHPQDILVIGSTMLQLIAPQNYRDQLPADEETHHQENRAPANVQHHSHRNTLALSQDTAGQLPRGTSRTSVNPPAVPPTFKDTAYPPRAQPPVNPRPQPPAAQENNHATSAHYDTPLPPLPGENGEQFWSAEKPENALSGITMQFALPQRMGARTRWLIAGIGLTILVVSAIITIVLNSLIGLSALQQNGFSSIVIALTIPLIPAVGIFLLVDFMDRFEREPWFLRLAAFLWGAIIAIPPALFIEKQIDAMLNSWLASSAGNIVLHSLAQALNAGITEESIKGLGLILLLIVLRDEFDNVTDGIVYGALIGAGFAMVENFGYFARNSNHFLLFLIVGRIILGWLGHSTFIACFGAALGYIRHTRTRWKQILIPLTGYLLAVSLHALFDFVDLQTSQVLQTAGGNDAVSSYALIAIVGNYIPPFLAQMGLLYVLIKSLAHEAAVIREFLATEVSSGIVLVNEYALLQNSFQRTKRERQVLRTQGVRQWMRVKALYQTEIGLAFRKWHVSMGDKPKLGYHQPEDAYRVRIRRLRSEIEAATADRQT